MSIRTFFQILIALAGWFAVVAQAWLMMDTGILPPGQLIWRFFSYFTILTNILTAIRFTALALQRGDHFFARPGVQTALTVYILVVGTVYNLVLRFLWAPQGLQRVVDELLHTLIPLACIAYWWLMVPKRTLRYQQVGAWLLFPVGYIVFVAVSGAISGFYPYPFVDVTRLGYPRALLNAVGLMMIFAGLGLFLTAVAQWTTHRQRRRD